MAKRKRITKQNTQTSIDFGHANPKQRLFYESDKLFTAYGGARGGGKTHAIRIKAVGGALTYPEIKILIIRRTYPELQKNHIEPILKMVPSQIANYNGTLHTMYFLNGSIIHFGHYQGLQAETEYQGQEYDWIFLDEATQFTEREFRFLGGLLRGVNDTPKRFYLTCNPGGVGHLWVKRLFVDKDYRTYPDNPEADENPDDYCFIQATVEDNPDLLRASPAYIQMLSSLPENIRKAHRYGDWNALSGAYFPEFSVQKHVMKPVPISPEWLRYRAFDYGLDMLACYWIAVDFNGRCYVYREYKKSGLIVSEATQGILDRTLTNEQIAITFAPPDMWSTQKDTGKTMAEIFMQCGLGIVRANNARVQGWLQLKELLKDMPDGKPGLMFFDTCQEIIDDLQSIQADDKNPDDCAKQPHDITHGPDALRYFAQSRTMAPEKMVEFEHDYYDEEEIEDYDEFMTGGEINTSYLYY